MSLNHHLLAKVTTDSILANFKSGSWKCCTNIGSDFYRVGCDSTFPSPDAVFFDELKNVVVSFEFKPPTETKRGILTGLGQSIAYLNNSNLSYLIIPETLDDFKIGSYMTDLFKNQINQQLPVGLIVYDNDIPTNVSLIHNINTLTLKPGLKINIVGRFWAKHQDLPIPLFHLLLHCYYLKKIGLINGDAFAYCWQTYLVNPDKLITLTPTEILGVNGKPIKTLSGKKNILFFEKKIEKAKKLNGSDRKTAVENLIKDADTTVVGDNYYNSVKKNFVTFLKHIGVIDSTGNLTDDGFKLYHLGLANGPDSKIFYDYFIKLILIVGNHLDLIFDLDNLCNKYRGVKTISEVKNEMLADYETRGMIKRNPNKKVREESSVEFLKYEFILWNSLGLTVKTNGKPDISFNWKKITEVCTLPDL
jgi:hypothetical protein